MFLFHLLFSNAHTESLKEHVYTWQTFDDRGEINSNEKKSVVFKRFQFTNFGKILVTLLVIVTIFVVLAGVFLLSYVFHFKGESESEVLLKLLLCLVLQSTD